MKTSIASRKKCPICGASRSVEYDPFCSRRCADVDLYHWLKGAYVVPGTPAAETSDDDAYPSPPTDDRAPRRR